MEGTCNCLISVSYEILQAKLSCGVGREKVSSGWKESPSGGAGLLVDVFTLKIHQAVHLGLVHFSGCMIYFNKLLGSVLEL